MPKDSSLRNLDQIPYPVSPLLIKSQADAIDEEDTPSMRELVLVIDTYAETVNLKVTSNLDSAEDAQV